MSPTETTTGQPPAAESGLPKQYRPSEHEKGVWESWIAAGAFHADPGRVVRGEAEPYCILIPPPNVTAALHLGHALNNTLQDVLTRAHRMRGFETLWMPGTDHAGIATQAVVEKRVQKEEKKRRTDFTREAFIAKIQAFKDEYEAVITGQLKAMGCSCDWDRQRFTMDPVCARAVREAFFRLFKDGLIYRGKRLVNWDPVLQTAVADDECYDEEVASSFWYLRYPLVHPHGATTQRERRAGQLPPDDAVPVTWSELALRGYPGAEERPPEEEAWVTVATTRPETYLGDTAVAVNPHDPRAKALRGLCVELPLVGRIIPIVEDDYVVLPKAMARTEEEAGDPKAEYATGFLKVTPAHDANDYDLYQRHKERIDTFAGGPGRGLCNMMSPEGRVSDKHGWVDVGDAHLFVGKKMAEARALVVKEFEARGLLESVRPYSHSVKHSDRSKAVIEPYLSDQWYVRVTDPRMAKAANAALVPDQRTQGGGTGLGGTDQGGTGLQTSSDPSHSLRFYPSRYAKTFEQWHDNIRDWCISRQLWWGHRIPVWSCEHFGGGAEAFVKFEQDLVEWQNQGRVFLKGRAESDPAGLMSNQRTDPVSQFFVCIRSSEDQEIIRSLERWGFTQDPDVLDTWFSSALWPLSTMGWPDGERAAAETGIADFPSMLAAFNPTSSLSTAREIITLWVSRMTMFNRYFLGPVPFKEVFIHAVIQDGEGRKMSKMLGNGVDPLDIIESHGADAMRYTLCTMATNTQDVRLPVVKDGRTGKNTSPKFDIGRNFANKVWNAARFTLTMLQGGPAAALGPGGVASLSLADRWMLSRLAAAVESCDRALANYEFAEYAQALYDVVWRDFCDWYLEAVKPTIASNPGQRTVLCNILSAVLRLLHPAMPFMTEAVWRHVGELDAPAVPGLSLSPARKGGLLATAGWPVADGALRDPGAEAEFARLQAAITAVREVRAVQNVAPKRRVTLHAPGLVASWLRGHETLVCTLAMLEGITDNAPPQGAASLTFEGAALHLSGLHEADEGGGAGIGETERAFLTKRKTDLEKEVKTYSGRLASPGYTQKAPPSMVQETTEKLEKARAELALVEGKLGAP
ncbi:MAG: valine--tRNA ligase [Phycisphaerae bacterium]|nr:valine--tRNA ligase [Phycisphaerae bacterium]